MEEKLQKLLQIKEDIQRNLDFCLKTKAPQSEIDQLLDHLIFTNKLIDIVEKSLIK